MNNDAKPFKQAVKSYYSGKTLAEDKLQALSALYDKHNVQDSRDNVRAIKTGQRRKWIYATSAIAASLFAVVLSVAYLQTPALITAAYADVQKDASLNNGLAAAQQEWISANHIAPIPAQYKVEMSKYCDLDGFRATHFRIAGEHQGNMNIFFNKGPRPYTFGRSSGKTDDLYWKVLESRQGFTVVVMYTEDMREKVVNTILNTMLPGIIA